MKPIKNENPRLYNLYRQYTYLDEITPERNEEYYYGLISGLILSALNGSSIDITIPIRERDLETVVDVIHDIIVNRMKVDCTTDFVIDLVELEPKSKDGILMFKSINQVAQVHFN